MKTERDERLEAWAARRLDERAAALDGATRSRLRQAREKALAQRVGWRRWLAGPPAAMAGVMAAAAVAIVAISLWTRMPEE
ncbi:MAG TPA: hypothetical protein EYH03_04220, partial [Chromatiales bacterium]|nr:hypothetical protein [Chromatiales bacterium]